MKLSTRWKSLLGTIGAAAVAAGVFKGGGAKPPIEPPPVVLHTVAVRVFEGPDVAADHKIPGAAVTLSGRALAADGAGNATFDQLTGGSYEACAAAAGFKRACVPASVPGPAIDLALEREVPPTLPVRVDGRFFVTDAGTFRPIFQSGLTLLVRGPPERAAFLDETRALGFNGVRVFAGALTWAPQTPAQALATLPALLDEAAARGLYVYVCALTDAATGYDVEAHLRAVGTIVRAHPNAILEVANEIGHGTQSAIVKDPARLLELARRVIPAGVVWTLGAPDGDIKTDEPWSDGTYPTDGGAFNDAHLDRGRDTWNQVRRLREIAAVSEATKKPAMSGEPIGADEEANGSKRRNDPEFFFAMGALCRGFELGCVFHSEAGLQGQRLGPTQRACAEAFIAGWRSIDTTDRLQFMNAGWPGSPVTKANFDTGIVRAYSFIAGGRGWTVLVGKRGDPAIEWGGGWRQLRVVAERPGVQVVEIQR